MSRSLEQRIIELETKVAFQDDTINQLNDELSRHQQTIRLLQEQILLLGNRFKEMKELTGSGQDQTMEHEIPPHY